MVKDDIQEMKAALMSVLEHETKVAMSEALDRIKSEPHNLKESS